MYSSLPFSCKFEPKQTDAVGIAEGEKALAGDERHDRVGAAKTLVNAGDRGEDPFGVERLRDGFAGDFGREDVQEHFRVARRVDVTAVGFIEFLLQGFGVREVAVVRKGDPVGSVHVEGLRLLIRARAPLRRIADLPDPHVPRQVAHVARAKDVAHKAHGLVHMEFQTVERGDARRVLTAMLQKVKRVVNALIHRLRRHHGNDTAHSRVPRKGSVGARARLLYGKILKKGVLDARPFS